MWALLGASFSYAATLTLSPSSGTHADGEIFSVDILLDTQGQAVDAVDIDALNYDTTLLSVVDEDSGTSGVQISPGTLFGSTNFNVVNTSSGAIQFSQATGSGTKFTGAGTLATVQFQVIGDGNASLSFTTGGTNNTNVAQDGNNVLTQALGGTYTVGDAGSPSTKFTIGQEIEITGSTVNVRSTPDGSVLGIQTNGNRGTVIGGPVFASNFWRWEIDFDTAPDGWIAEDFADVYSPPQAGFDFSVSDSGNRTVTQGGSANNTITVGLVSGTSQSVNLSVSGLPSNTNSSFSQSSCTPGCSSTLTLTTTGSTPTGVSTITVTGTSGTTTRQTSFTLTVNAPADTTPPVISSVGASGVTTNSATISWATNEGATSQVQYGPTTSYGNTTPLSSTLVTAHGVSLTGLSPNTTYNYRVLSADGAGNSAQSLNRTFTTQSLPDTQAPVAISNLSASNIGMTSLNLSWSAPSDLPSGSALSYDIRYRTSPLTEGNWGGATIVSGEPSPGSPGTSEAYTLVGLQEGTTYYIGIKSIDSVGNISLLSNIVTATTDSVVVIPDPTVSITANGDNGSTQISYNSSATLSWTSTNAVTCTASGAWSGVKSLVSTEGTGNLASNQTYTITCQNSEGTTAQDSVVVNVGAPPEPTLSFLVNGGTSNITLPSPNSGATLSWTATDATSCTASGDWSGSKGTSGNEGTGSLTQGESYTLACTGPGGSIQESRTVNVQLPDPIPTLDFLVNGEEGPITVTEGDTITLSWDATNSTFCSASGDWTGAFGDQGSRDVVVTEDSTFNLACLHTTQTNGYVLESITVNTVPPQVSVSLQVNNETGPITISSGGSVTLSWTALNADSCTASNGSSGWSGTQSTTGTATISGITQSSSYVITCTNAAGSQSDSVSVNIAGSQQTGSGNTGGGSGSGGGGSFGGGVDTVPPQPPTNVRVLGGPDQIVITWDNPNDSDFVRVIVVRKEDSAPTSVTDGTAIYEGTGEEFTDTNIISGVDYFYSVFAFDTNVNFSIGQGGSSFAGAFTEDQISDELSQKENQCIPGAHGGGLTLTRSMTIGTRGEDVRQLQQFLNANGFIVSETGGGSPGNETTFFGRKSEAAVRAFQCAQGVVCSGTATNGGYGRVGPRTRAALSAFSGGGITCEEPETPISAGGSGSVSITRWLTIGTRGEDVQRLQVFLNANGFTVSTSGGGSPGNETTFFGSKTQAAVRLFQCSRGIVCSGSVTANGYGAVGPRTRAALRGE